jgi:type IV pilus assembly protein PilY1
LTSSVPVVAGYGSAPAELLNVTGASSVSLTDLAVKRGWFMDLFTTTQPYEQVVTTPLTIGGVTYFNTYQAAGEGSTCSNLGTARGYAVDFQTGVQQKNDLGELAPMEYLSQGIPPPPRGGTVDVDGETVTFCISCAGEKSILDPEEPIVKLRPSRKPVYRYQRIDKQ